MLGEQWQMDGNTGRQVEEWKLVETEHTNESWTNIRYVTGRVLDKSGQTYRGIDDGSMEDGQMLERCMEIWMDEWTDGGLMDMEYMSECWVATRMEGCCLDIGQIGRRIDVVWMGGCWTDES